MRYIGLIVALTTMWVHATAAQDFPLRLPIAADSALVFAGPDAAHYSTSRLEAGSVVDVYRLDPGDWCAIRPPTDSFCMVEHSAVAVSESDKAIGTITRDEEKCWIGTMLGPVDEPMWQVKLKQGERVRVLGEIPANPDDPSSTGWYQISPPNGEFRWMQLADFAPQDQQLIVAACDSDSSAVRLVSAQDDVPLRQRLFGRRSQKSTSAKNVESADDQLQVQVDEGGKATAAPLPAPGFQADDRSATNEPRVELTAADDDANVWRPARRPLVHVAERDVRPSTMLASMDSHPAGVASTTSISNGNDLPRLAAELPADARWPAVLQALDLRLSNEVLKEPSSWNLSSLAAEVQSAKTTFSTASDLAVADHLLNKIRRFQQIQNSQNALAHTAAASTGSANQVQAAPPSILGYVGQQPLLNQRPTDPSATIDPVIAEATKFDAYGWLSELVTDNGLGQTMFALKDEDGKITSLVSPAPGLNLHRFLNAKIGVVGQKGFHQKFKLDHVTAERVVRLDSTVQR